jgi:carboxyl-terminal processing protease
MRHYRIKIISSIFIISLLTFVFSPAAYTLSSRPAPSEPQNTVWKIPESVSVELGIIERTSDLICQGNFDAADDLVKQSYGEDPNELNNSSRQLLEIVEEYKNISEQMKLARDAAYEEKLAELDQLRIASESDVNDINDVNDVNDVTVILSAIVEVSEIANKEQKEQLLSDAYVQKVLQEAIDKAAEFEVEGKWLEAYTNCYYWLSAIDPEENGYSDYAQKLYEKAVIAASLQDNACETREERYHGVDKTIFIRAIGYLDMNFVNKLDYKLMAINSIERCQLLGEVMEFPPEDFQITIENQQSETEYKQSLSAWSTSLVTLQEEIEQLSTDVDRDKFLEVFEKVLQLNEVTVNLPQDVLIAQFSDSAFSALDSYTVIVWPREVQDFEKLMTNEFSGIGVEISKPKGLLTIASLLPDTPAYKSGLDAGDVIEAVDGIETKDMTLTCAVSKITGPKGTKVTLRIRRPGEEETRDVVITRGIIVVPTIRGWQRTEVGQWRYMIDSENKIGYVRLTSFSSETASDLEKVLNELEAEGLRGLILDLRFNSGGLLDSAIAVSEKFIEEGMIVYRVPRTGGITIYEDAHKKGTHPYYPLLILINSSSASASEIVAGALADEEHERAILVGSRTHGKGSVQGITGFIGGGAQLKYTMAYYHLPSGQRVESRDEMEKLGREDWGVGPDVEVELTNDEIRDMIEVQRDNDVLVQANHNEEGLKVTKHTIEKTLASDRQLAVGLLVLRSKLVQTDALAKAQTGS